MSHKYVEIRSLLDLDSCSIKETIKFSNGNWIGQPELLSLYERN